MKLFIARHGETDCNVQHLIAGTTDAQLTETGKKQAQELAEKILQKKDEYNIKIIFVSNLQRARDTASYIEKALNIKAIIDRRIQEIDFGNLEKKPWPNEEFSYIRRNPFIKHPNGESLSDGIHRSYSLIDEVKEKYKNCGGNVLFVCHRLITVLMMTYFKSISQEEFMETGIKNCELLEFDLF